MKYETRLKFSFEEGSITEEEFPILNEEYESEGQEYKLKIVDVFIGTFPS